MKVPQFSYLDQYAYVLYLISYAVMYACYHESQLLTTSGQVRYCTLSYQIYTTQPNFS